MDSKDKKLLLLLQNDAKQTTKQLAQKLDLSATSIFERIKKLERQKIIEKYVCLINKKQIDKNFIVLSHVKLAQHKKEYIAQFEKEIIQFPEVLECFHVAGEFDYILKICVKDIEEYRDFMVSKLTNLQHIGSTQSSFMIKEVKNSTVIEP